MSLGSPKRDSKALLNASSSGDPGSPQSPSKGQGRKKPSKAGDSPAGSPKIGSPKLGSPKFGSPGTPSAARVAVDDDADAGYTSRIPANLNLGVPTKEVEADMRLMRQSSSLKAASVKAKPKSSKALDMPATTGVSEKGHFRPTNDKFYIMTACCCAITGLQFSDLNHLYLTIELCCLRHDTCCLGKGNQVFIAGEGDLTDSCLAVGFTCCSLSLVTPKGLCYIEHHCFCFHFMANLMHSEGFRDMPFSVALVLMLAPACGCCSSLATVMAAAD